MMNIDYPRIPLAQEQHAALLSLGSYADNSEVNRIRREFAQRRDAEFPGWREKYDREFKEWTNRKGASA